MTNKEAIESLQNIVEYWGVRPTEREAAKLAIKSLEQQDKERWVPCKVEVPGRSGYYIVTIDYGKGTLKCTEFLYYDINEKIWEFVADGEEELHTEWREKCNAVVAWQPTPEPYKEGNI